MLEAEAEAQVTTTSFGKLEQVLEPQGGVACGGESFLCSSRFLFASQLMK